MNPLRIGMVGTGFIADYHLSAFSKFQGVEIAGIHYTSHSQAPSQEKLLQIEEFCAKWKTKNYQTFDSIVKDPDIDALIIGSVNPLHFEEIMSSLDHGKHVLVEKPVVTDFRLLDEIEKKAKQSGLVVFPAHNFVYRSAVRKAKEILDWKKLGKIVYSQFISSHTISSNHANGWRGKLALSSGGALMDSGHHLVYQSLYLMGLPEKIQSFQSNLILKQMEGEDIGQINILYPDGSIGTIMQSWTTDSGDEIGGIKIVGTEGHLEVTDALYVNGEKVDSGADYPSSFDCLAEAFVRAIKNGEKPLSDLADVRNTLKIIFGAYESNRNNKVIQLS